MGLALSRTDGFIDSLFGLAADQGMTVRISEDFHAFLDWTRTAGRVRPCPPFDPIVFRNDIANAVWVGGWDKRGRLVHTQAVRFHQVQTSLADHFLRQVTYYTPPNIEIEMEGSRFCEAPAMRQIAGRLCYHGEMWICPGHASTDDGFRGKRLSSILPRIGMALALERWAPDYIWGIVRTDMMFRGLSVRCGYMAQQPGLAEWRIKDSNDRFHEWLVYSDLEELKYLLQRPPSEF